MIERYKNNHSPVLTMLPRVYPQAPTLLRKRIIYALPQRGKHKSIIRDGSRRALLPGKRISRNGKVYWETRRNRSDSQGSRY